MPNLIIHKTGGDHEFQLTERTSIGRHPDNHIQLVDRLVSKEHCLIFSDHRGIYVIRDVGSQNGTFVNDRRIRGDQVLRDGDRIKVGSTLCIFSSTEARPHVTGIEGDGTILILSQTSSKMPEDRFLPEREIWDDKVVRADYEKLRVAHELQRDIGVELHLDRIFSRILDRTFELFDCDRAVILLPDDEKQMAIRAFKTRNKMDKVIVSSTILRHVQNEKVGIISSNALADERFAKAESVILQNIR